MQKGERQGRLHHKKRAKMYETIERERYTEEEKKMQGERNNNSQGVWWGEESEVEKASEHCTACHWPPGVNNPSRIDLPARPSRAFWINLKLISMPEVGKTSSGAYQKYSGAGRIWQGNLSHCTTGNGLWAPRAAWGRACSLYTHAHTHARTPTTHTQIDSASLHVPNTAMHWHMLPNVQHSSEREWCA